MLGKFELQRGQTDNENQFHYVNVTLVERQKKIVYVHESFATKLTWRNIYCERYFSNIRVLNPKNAHLGA